MNSFCHQFNEYIKGQTCFELESFVVNNMLGDSTYISLATATKMADVTFYVPPKK